MGGTGSPLPSPTSNSGTTTDRGSDPTNGNEALDSTFEVYRDWRRYKEYRKRGIRKTSRFSLDLIYSGTLSTLDKPKIERFLRGYNF